MPELRAELTKLEGLQRSLKDAQCFAASGQLTERINALRTVMQSRMPQGHRLEQLTVAVRKCQLAKDKADAALEDALQRVCLAAEKQRGAQSQLDEAEDALAAFRESCRIPPETGGGRRHRRPDRCMPQGTSATCTIQPYVLYTELAHVAFQEASFCWPCGQGKSGKWCGHAPSASSPYYTGLSLACFSREPFRCTEAIAERFAITVTGSGSSRWLRCCQDQRGGPCQKPSLPRWQVRSERQTRAPASSSSVLVPACQCPCHCLMHCLLVQ